MTREDIIKLAREAGIVVTGEAVWRLCELVAAAEREACAKVCEDMSGPIEVFNPKYVHYIDCAAAIRARNT